MNSAPSEVASATDFQDLVVRTEGLQPWRRVFHAASGVLLAITVGALGPGSTATRALLAFAVVFGVVLDIVRLNSLATNRWFFRRFSALVSPREAAGVASSTWYVVGVLLVQLTMPAAFLVPSILVLALADPAASVVGRVWGRRPLGKGSVEGALTFWVVATATMAPTAGVPKALGAAALVAICEVLPTKADDNLLIPIVAALALWMMG